MFEHKLYLSYCRPYQVKNIHYIQPPVTYTHTLKHASYLLNAKGLHEREIDQLM